MEFKSALTFAKNTLEKEKEERIADNEKRDYKSDARFRFLSEHKIPELENKLDTNISETDSLRAKLDTSTKKIAKSGTKKSIESSKFITNQELVKHVEKQEKINQDLVQALTLLSDEKDNLEHQIKKQNIFGFS